MNWQQWIQFIVSLLPTILGLVSQVEQAVGAGNGSIKKNIVLNSVVETAGGLHATNPQVETIKGIASSLVDAHVSALNAAGVFVKKAA